MVIFVMCDISMIIFDISYVAYLAAPVTLVGTVSQEIYINFLEYILTWIKVQ